MCLPFSFSYSEEYIQQYEVGDTGPNGGTVTSVTVDSVFVGEEVVQDGDFLDVTYTYEYTETVVEEVEEVSVTTTTQVTQITSPNLITEDSFTTDTNISLGGNYGMPGADFTTGNQQTGGGGRVYEGSFPVDNKDTLEYGATVYSHGSNAVLPPCQNTTGDCRDEFRITMTLFHEEQVVETYTHSYTGVNWSGSRQYDFSQDVSTLTFDYGTMELYGIDRGFYGGYYGPGFSDPYVYLTYNVIEEVIQRVVSYVEMRTVTTTEVYAYDSIYNPTVEVLDIQLEPISDTEFEVIVEVQDMTTEIVEVFEVEVETVAPEIESFETEMEIEEVEVFESEIEEPVGETAEVTDVQPEEGPTEEGSGQLQEEAEASEPDAVEKPKASSQSPSKAAKYSVALDTVRVALMVQNDAARAFDSYRQEAIPDVPFYSPVQIDGGETVDNPLGRWMTGASDLLMEEMVDMQWQR